MIYRKLKNWTDTKKLEALIYFAQLIDELLFDYSLDTYKPSAMNSSALCKEVLDLIQDIDDEIINEANLTHVVKELIVNLKSDEVAKSLLGMDFKDLIAKLGEEVRSINELKTIIEIINSRIEFDKYKIENEKLLYDSMGDARQKNRIRALTRSYITTLISIGYHPRYLYPTTRRFFFWGKNGISSIDAINDYFKHFGDEAQSYVAIFKANKIFEEIKESCISFDMVITADKPDEYAQYIDEKNHHLGDKSVYVIQNKFNSKDVHSARNLAQKSIDMISTLTTLFHHKEIPSWDNNVLLVNLKSKKSRIISSSQNPMLKCADLSTSEAAIKLNSFINEFSFDVRDERSFQRFFRCTELHSLALKNDSPENQLLNLWVALETLVPSDVSISKAKINNIIDSILPFLSLTYFSKLIDYLLLDINKYDTNMHDGKLFIESTKGIIGENDKEKLLKLLLLGEYKEQKDYIMNEFGDFYLLRNRFFYFSECLKSTGQISKNLDSHWKRVDWQIRRIYRARNSIVHAGITPDYIEILINNIHDYVDTVINSIIKLASDGNKINSTNQAFIFSDIKYSGYIKKLKEDDQIIDKDNINELLIDDLL